MQETLQDVIIVGYGPVGQLLALKLGQAGHSVAVVERWPLLFHAPRAVHYDHEIARIFQGAGVGAQMAQIADEPDVAEVFSGAGELLMQERWAGPGASGWPRANGFAQPELEAILDNAVRTLPNVQVFRGWEATALTQSPDEVRVTVRPGRHSQPAEAMGSGERSGAGWHHDGAGRELQARYVVGANSFVRGQMSTSLTDLDFHSDWLVVNVQWKPGKERHFGLRQLLFPARPTTMTPAGRNRRRWEFMLLPGESREHMNREETAWSLLAEHGVTPDDAVLDRHAVYTFQASWANEWRRGRVILAGDAARMMPPFMAQGTCSGIRDAASLAWRLPMVLRGAAPESLLDSYMPERLAHVQALIYGSVEIGKMFCMLDTAACARRDAGLRAAMKDPAFRPPPPPPPRLGAGVMREGDPHAGQLSIQGRVAVGHRTGLFDDVVGCGFALIATTFDPAEYLTLFNREFFATLGGVLAQVGPTGPVRDLEGTYTAAFADRGIAACLTRPDFYQFGAGDGPGELNAMVDSLRAQLCAA